ncbi:MAG: hypothetical protein VB031_06750 [Eubacteriaceae bacterium]|nr:hypothetical protein [Eubacteriaceae bacterium]
MDTSTKKELEYFRIEGSYGGNQDWFRDYMMKIGGCAAVTACDSSIYFDMYKGTRLYPNDIEHLTRRDYVDFSKIMKPYLRPRWKGINTLELYMDGFGRYISDRANRVGFQVPVSMSPFRGSEPYAAAESKIIQQIYAGMPVPFLTLHHKDPALSYYEWHWFLLTGYDRSGGSFAVKAVTYGSPHILDFAQLWDTGYEEKGGMIIYE